MYKSTLAFLMPSMILSKAVRTAADGPTAVRPPVAGEGEAAGSADLLAVFGVGDGFGATVRPRPAVDVFVFCAETTSTKANRNRIEAATKDRFMAFSSS